ncbi:MAG TPA: AIR synthase related protein [Tepidisphaeraceae bacterium]|nr:AIR synthase related protein [Tepidisphaeraceae bacterium]
MSEPLTYNSAGVNYDSLDAFKRACQRAAAGTRDVLGLHGFSEPADVRGESAYLIESADRYLAHVEEGLGTKNLVADAMLELTGRSYYRNIGIDTVATIVNDLITCGALPVSVAMHAAVGDGAWFDHPRRATDLADGFAEGCRAAQAVWGGGETPALRGIVDPSTIVLAGSAVGQISPKSLRIAGDVEAGDAIVMLASSGVQTNGLTLCRKLAERLPQGYLTPLSDGRTYGEALLDPSVIYVRFVRAAQQAHLTLRYAIHLTGHGWRKIMRLGRPFVYEITHIPTPQPVFSFIADHAQLPPAEAYATFNMGVGFAAIVRSGDAERCVELARSAGYDAWIGGTVRSDGDRKAVEIVPLDVRYDEASLQLR